jgi:hypothetical protein
MRPQDTRHRLASAWAQEVAPPKEENSQTTPVVTQPAAEVILRDSKVIVLVLDAAAQQSEVVKQVILVSMSHSGIVSPPDLEHAFGNRGPQRILAHLFRASQTVSGTVN